MGHTAAVRILEPIDPRTVWAAVQIVVNAPESYTWRRYPAGGEMGPNACWFADSGQGADALAHMYYAPEGAPLDDSEYRPEDDYASAQIPPRGYVEVFMTTGYAHTAENIGRAHLLVAMLGRRQASLRDDFDGTWATARPARHPKAG